MQFLGEIPFINFPKTDKQSKTIKNQRKRLILFGFSFYSLLDWGHANNLPITEQAVKTKPKQVFFIILTVYLLFKCCFLAW